MAKRTRARVVYDSDSEYVGESDASFTPSSRKSNPNPTGTTQVQRKKRRVTKSNIQTPADSGHDKELTPEVRVHSNTATSHLILTHVICNPKPLREALLNWYSSVHEVRGMPWRKLYDPTLNSDERAQRAYEVWISEIMLQQTQVVTVIPYYNKWMARFPTIADLAASDIETVNALWKGLGYYSRAARLLSAAKKAVAELGGRLPDNAKDMQANIPGIGRYSAGAICSIAYNECVPVLDGNVNRLLSRVLALHANPKAKSTLDVLWAGAEAMVREADRAGDVNQALIELGATICKVRDPDCSSCPLQTWCRAYQYEHGPSETAPSAPENFTANNDVPDIEELCSLCEQLPLNRLVTAYPMKVERKKAREELDVVNVVEWRHRDNGSQDRWFLLVRRPEGGLLAGLHEFPTSPDVSKTLSASAMRDIPHRLLSELLTTPPMPYTRTAGLRPGRSVEGSTTSSAVDRVRIASVRSAGDVTHVFSHIKKTYRVQWVVLEGGGQEPPSLALRQVGIGGGKKNAQGAKPSKRQKSSTLAKTEGNDDSEHEPVRAMWLLMTDVPDANVGTGVLKVWKQASALWDTDTLTATE